MAETENAFHALLAHPRVTLMREEIAGHKVDDHVEELGQTVGEALLTPTQIYVRPVRQVLAYYRVKNVVHGIAHITGPRHHGNLTGRARGFLRTLGNLGCPEPLVLHGQNNFQGGYELTRDLLPQPTPITAIFAANDIMAFGAARAIHESGRRIPEDMSLIGFDNLELVNDKIFAQAGKRSIRRSLAEIIERALEKLFVGQDRQRGSTGLL